MCLTYTGLCGELEHLTMVYYEVIKRELNRRRIYECRCDERLKVKVEGSSHTLGREGDWNLRWDPWYQGTRAPEPWALVPGHFLFYFIFYFGGSFFFH
jgi:hypothetical protein